jgi:hypothetical protein
MDAANDTHAVSKTAPEAGRVGRQRAMKNRVKAAGAIEATTNVFIEMAF